MYDSSKRTLFLSTRHRGLSYRERKDGRTYFGYIPSKGRIRLDSVTEREAVAEYGELRGKVRKGYKPPAAKRFAEVAEEWWASYDSPQTTSTRKLYRMALDRYLLKRLGHLMLRDIDLFTLKSLVASWRRDGLSRSTIENYLCPVRAIFAYAIEAGLISENPCSQLKGKHLPEKAERDVYEWSDEEIETFLKASEYIARQPESRYDYSPILKTAVFTGLRLGELLGLQWRDVDLGDKPVLTVRRQWTRYSESTEPKTRNGLRRVPLVPEAVTVLREQRRKAFAAGHAFGESPVFASKAGTALSHRNVQRRGFEPARDHAELPGELHFHDLRHAFASIAHARGVSVSFLSQMLGHSDIGVTQRVYIHLFGREEQEDAFRTAMAVARSA